MANLWASKSVKQIDDASIYLPKATGSSFLHFKGRCTGGPQKFPPTRWHIRGSWQLFKCLCCFWNSAKMAHLRGFGSLLKMTIRHVSEWHVCHLIGGVCKRTVICCRSPLASDFCKSTICNCLFHIFGLSMLSNVVKETAMTLALNIRKKSMASN